MNIEDVCKQELGAEWERVQANLPEFDEPLEKPFIAGGHNAIRVENLKQKINVTITKLKNQRDADANEDVWDLLRYC